VAVISSDEHSSLLPYGIVYGRKKIYGTCPQTLHMGNKVLKASACSSKEKGGRGRGGGERECATGKFGTGQEVIA